MTPLEFDPPIPEAVWAGKQVSHACRWQGARVLVLSEQRPTGWSAAFVLLLAIGVAQFFFVMPGLSSYVFAALGCCAVYCEQQHRRRRCRTGHGVVVHPDDITWFGPEGIERQVEWLKVTEIEEVRTFGLVNRLVVNGQAALKLGRQQRMLLMSAASACSPAKIEGTWLKSLGCLAPLTEVLDLEPMTFRRIDPKDERRMRPNREAGSAIARGFVIFAAALALGSLFPSPFGWGLGLVIIAVAVLLTLDHFRLPDSDGPLPAWSKGALTWTGQHWELVHDGQVRRLSRMDADWGDALYPVESESVDGTMYDFLQSFQAENGVWYLLSGSLWVLEAAALGKAWMPTENKAE